MSTPLTIRSAQVEIVSSHHLAVAHALSLGVTGMLSKEGPPEDCTEFDIIFRIDGVDRKFEVDSIAISRTGSFEAISFDAYDRGETLDKTYVVMLDPAEGGLQQVTIHNAEEDYHPTLRDLLAAMQ